LEHVLEVERAAASAGLSQNCAEGLVRRDGGGGCRGSSSGGKDGGGACAGGGRPQELRVLRLLEAAYTIYKGMGGGGRAEEEDDGEEGREAHGLLVVDDSWLHLSEGLCGQEDMCCGILLLGSARCSLEAGGRDFSRCE